MASIDSIRVMHVGSENSKAALAWRAAIGPFRIDDSKKASAIGIGSMHTAAHRPASKALIAVLKSCAMVRAKSSGRTS
jgi:hypothetical protein